MSKFTEKEIEALVFDGVDMDDDDAYYEALGVYENTLKLKHTMDEEKTNK